MGRATTGRPISFGKGSMMISNTLTRYGSVAKVFHWLTALLILTLIPLGVVAHELPYETSEQLALKATLFSAHKTLGVTVFFVALLRIFWALTQPKPAPIHPDRKLETGVAEIVHWLLYGSLVLMPLTGWIHHAATDGFAPIWWPFGQDLPFVPKSESLAGLSGGLHHMFANVLILAVALHIAGALKHQVIDKDATLSRMWFGTTEAGETRATHSKAPALVALAIWGAALGFGVFGATADREETDTGEALASVESEWAVQDGTLSIAVTQLGSEVGGSFSDWTAAISFDEGAAGPKVGTVEVTIAIGSLTLGSVTKEALGADFLNQDGFPEAVYSADLLREGDGYVADGALTLRGVTLPLRFPIDLTVEGDRAEAEGSTAVDRRDFRVGEKQTDEASLGFGVSIGWNLIAERQ